MYRETIEHPIAIPEDIKEHLDLQSGGRPRADPTASSLPAGSRACSRSSGAFPPPNLSSHLSATNSWERGTAQRLLWERQDATAVAPARELARSGKTPLARVHAADGPRRTQAR